MFTKNVTPNLIALIIIGISFTLAEPWQSIVLSTGLFALSGALTNWLAVHMLFERVPGLYGSGVITLHFESFKEGILKMVHDELFSQDSVERLLAKRNSDQSTKASEGGVLGNSIELEPILKSIDLNVAYDELVATIVNSSFGSMLSMLGGESALEPLREPFKERMQTFLIETANKPAIKEAINQQISKAASSEQFISKLEHLLKARLDEMTPDMVKDIIQRMIREHLGWLVVWGGVFGGAIGLIAGLLQMA